MNEEQKKQIAAGIRVVAALAETIRELGETPSGHLYAHMMAFGMTLENYNEAIAMLKRAKLVEETNHLLRWVGRKIETVTS